MRRGRRSLAALLLAGLMAFYLLELCPGTAFAAGSSTWSMTFGGGKPDSGYSIVRVDDGYVIAGQTSSIGDADGDVYVVRTTNTGSQRWQNAYGGKSRDDGSCLIRDGDHYVIAGSTESYGNGSSDVWLLKINAATGKEVWNKTYGTSSLERANAVARIGDYYVIAGQSGNKALLLKTDLNGNQKWSKTYNSGSGMASASDVVAVGNDYLAVGRESDRLMLLKVQAGDGSVLKKKTPPCGSGDSMRATAVTADAKNFYVAGWRDVSGDLSAYVLAIDANLEKDWDLTFDGNRRILHISDIVITDGGLVIAGDLGITSSGESLDYVDPYLAWLSRDGRHLGRYVRNETGYQYLRSLALAPDGDYVVAGYVVEGSDSDLYLAKISANMLNPTPTPRPATPTPVAPTASAAEPTPEGGYTSEPTEEPGISPEPIGEPLPVGEPTAREPTEVQSAGPTTSATPAPAVASPTGGPAATPEPTPAPAGLSGGIWLGGAIIVALLAVVAVLVLVVICFGAYFLLMRK